MKYVSGFILIVSFIGCNGSTGSFDTLGSSAASTSDSSSSSSASKTTSPTVNDTPAADPVYSHHMYVINKSDNTISQYGIDDTTKNLVPIAGNETIPTGSQPVDIKMSLDKKYVFVLNYNDHTIWVYSVDDATGALTQMVANTTAVSTFTSQLGIGPNGIHIYAKLNPSFGTTANKFILGSSGPGALTYIDNVLSVNVGGTTFPLMTTILQGSIMYRLIGDSVQKYTSANVYAGFQIPTGNGAYAMLMR